MRPNMDARGRPWCWGHCPAEGECTEYNVDGGICRPAFRKAWDGTDGEMEEKIKAIHAGNDE